MANIFARFAGRLCEALRPIKHDLFLGNAGSSTAICTLSSMDLLEQVARSELIKSVALVGRLLSENKGIEKLIGYVLAHGNLKYIVLCGKDTKGHFPGQALLALHKNGIDAGRIVGALGSDPVLEDVSTEEVEEFRKRITLIDAIGTSDIGEISARVTGLTGRSQHR